MAYLVGFKKLGHDIYFVEKSTWEDSCYDLSKKIMTSDFSYGLSVITGMMKKFGLENHWSFVDEQGGYHGLSKKAVREIFNSADIFIDMEWGEWEQESHRIPKRCFFDGEPGWLQMKLTNLYQAGGRFPDYDFWFTAGANIGTDDCTIPLAGVEWHHTYSPILPDDSLEIGLSENSAFTTVMNWQSNKVIEYNKKTYGQKDLEFEKFVNLPSRTGQKLEIAVSSRNVPTQRLIDNGWRVKNADDVAQSIDSYLTYIARSKGEFSVAKNVFVETQAGVIGDRSAYYLYYGKPVIHQETGFSKNLPCGSGLFAVKNCEEAAAAIECVCQDYKRHSKAAKEIAREYFITEKVVQKILTVLGV
jgi:hypothetical protein